MKDGSKAVTLVEKLAQKKKDEYKSQYGQRFDLPKIDDASDDEVESQIKKIKNSYGKKRA